jgi:CBS domain-containing protein
MQIDKIMHRNVKIIGPDETLRDAATAMKKLDVGVLPVGEHDKLVGMITDRDIVIRGIAEGKGPDTKAREVMSHEVKYCFEDEAVEHVAENMAELQVRRLPVLNRDKRLVGIVSIWRPEARCPRRQERCTGFRDLADSTIRAKRPEEVPAAQQIRAKVAWRRSAAPPTYRDGAK